MQFPPEEADDLEKGKVASKTEEVERQEVNCISMESFWMYDAAARPEAQRPTQLRGDRPPRKNLL